MIKTLRKILKEFNVDIGYSCHVPMPEGLDCVISAIENGATFIEKHYSTSRLKIGNDHYHAMTAEDLNTLRKKENFINELNNQASSVILYRRTLKQCAS